MIILETIILTKIPINKNRRLEIKNIVYKALVHCGSVNIPIEIKKISKSFTNIRVIPFSIQMKRRNMSLQEVYYQCGTEDACADYYANAGSYIIYYNDVVKWKYIDSNRYRWSIAHELGHILLEHHIKYEKTRIFRSELSDSEYDYLETEADYFAQLILVPHSPLWGFNIQTSNHLKILCKISGPASRKRMYEYNEWKYNGQPMDDYDNHILDYYQTYVYKKKCKICSIGLVQRHGKYCPICGSKNTLEWGDGDTMKYPLLETHDSGKLKECPNCENEETEIDGDFCHICGKNLVNKCASWECDNTNILPSNARHCPICGGNSVFYNANFLQAWNYKEKSPNEFWSIPDGIDPDTLPFY